MVVRGLKHPIAVSRRTQLGDRYRIVRPRAIAAPAEEVDFLGAHLHLNGPHASLPALAGKPLPLYCGCHETRYLKTVTL